MWAVKVKKGTKSDVSGISGGSTYPVQAEEPSACYPGCGVHAVAAGYPHPAGETQGHCHVAPATNK